MSHLCATSVTKLWKWSNWRLMLRACCPYNTVQKGLLWVCCILFRCNLCQHFWKQYYMEFNAFLLLSILERTIVYCYLSQNVAWDCFLIPVHCMYCEPKTVLFDLQNNFRFATRTKHGNQQIISCRIIA